MGTVKLRKFWSSIINDGSVQDNLKSVMSIEDAEERALQLISRTLFLIVMEIKHERDQAAKNLKWIKENGSICSSCGEKVQDDAVDLWTSEGADVNYAKLQNQRKTDSAKSLKSPANKEISSKQINQVCGKEDISRRDHESQEVKDTKSPRSYNKADRTYRCLSRSPKEVSPNISKEDEGDVKRMTENKVQKIVPYILVPETVSLDEHELYVNLQQRKALATQTVSVPDTLAIDNTKNIDESKYENTDIFDSSLSDGGTCAEKVDALDSHFRREMQSPSKDEVKMSEPKNHGSPVLGKQNHMAPLGAVKHSIKGDLPKVLDFEDVSKGLVELKTPESRGTKAVEFVVSTPRYSPLLFTHNLSTSLNNSVDNVSPSLLPAVKSKSPRSGNEENWIPPSVKPIDFVHKEKQSTSKTKTGLQKSMSHCNTSPPATKSRGLRKCQSVDRKNKGTMFKMSLDPADPEAKKRYKQTKITASTFLQKANMARNKGSEQGKSFSILDEAAAIGAALEESLKTKALDDMMREKRKALQTVKAFSHETLDGATTTADGKCNQSVGGLVNDTSRSPGSELTKPLVSQGVHVASKSAACSPKKEKMEKMEDSPIKIPKLSPGNCRTSPSKRKQQKQSPCSPVKKKKKLKKQGEMKIEDEEEVLNLEQLLDQVSQSHIDTEQIVSKKASSAQGKTVQKKRKKQIFVDSFDIIPAEKTEPSYAYRGEVVRKKIARKQLEGWQCHECEQWYKGQNLTSEEIKVMMNKCSRHRSKHNPVTNTPKDFWNPDWIDDD